MCIAGSVGVIFGVCAVADDKELDIFEEPGACPERIPLVAVDLVEGFFEIHASALELNVNERQTVYENGDIISVGPGAVFRHILIDDLQEIPVYVILVDEFDIAECVAAIRLADGGHLDEVVLDGVGLFQNTIVLVGQMDAEECFPIRVCKMVVIELLQLLAKVGNEGLLVIDGEILITLLLELLNESILQHSFTLVVPFPILNGDELSHQSTFRVLGNNIEFRHCSNCL